MEHGALQHPLKTERGLHVRRSLVVFLVAQPWSRIVDELFEIAAQLDEVGAARLERFDHLRRVEQREQQMLDGDELVAFFAGALERVVETIFELVRKHYVSSMVQSSGC